DESNFSSRLHDNQSAATLNGTNSSQIIGYQIFERKVSWAMSPSGSKRLLESEKKIILVDLLGKSSIRFTASSNAISCLPQGGMFE
ncbi:unnamed protein product, partial [Ceratitis capitata]